VLIGYYNSKKDIEKLSFYEDIRTPNQFLSSMIKSIEEASIKIQSLEELVKTLLNNRLTKKQLKLLSGIMDKEGLLYYQLIEILSREFSMPMSTVKWNLSRLRELKIIIAGDKNNKGIPVRITLKGKMLLKIFNEKLHIA
jgi:DNA-binding transcriptional ArsR family regulator